MEGGRKCTKNSTREGQARNLTEGSFVSSVSKALPLRFSLYYDVKSGSVVHFLLYTISNQVSPCLDAKMFQDRANTTSFMIGVLV